MIDHLDSEEVRVFPLIKMIHRSAKNGETPNEERINMLKKELELMGDEHETAGNFLLTLLQEPITSSHLCDNFYGPLHFFFVIDQAGSQAGVRFPVWGGAGGNFVAVILIHNLIRCISIYIKADHTGG